MKRFLAVLLVMVLIPYVPTLAWTGRLGDGNIAGIDEDGGVWLGSAGNGAGDSVDGVGAGERYVVVVRDGVESRITVEEYLIHVLAAQIPADFGPETLKAQAVLARTYVYGEMEAAGGAGATEPGGGATDGAAAGANTIYEEALDMDALSRAQMEKKWGSGDFAKMYGKLKTAVDATAGMCVTYEGKYIEPLFCFASAGMTRTRGDEYPYLKQVESDGDLLADGYLSMPVFSGGEMAEKINSISGAVPVTADQLPGEIQIVERDNAGYVKHVQIGQKTYTGEEVQYALGLSSSCYSFEKFDGKIRVVCKGVGHGYGFSQTGANALEKEGRDFKELLGYYFQNVEIWAGA